MALVDLFLAGESGTDVCAAIRRESPSTRVLLISGAGRMSPAAARAAGASGFVSKDLEAAEVTRAVRMVGAGMTLFPPKVDQPAPLLTEREREVLVHIARGLSNAELVEELHISLPTVKAHVGRVLAKLGARDRTQLVVIAYESGLVASS